MRGIVRLVRTKVGFSFLLALLSWIVLSLVWNRTEIGSPAFKFIAAVMRPGFNAGHYLAASFFGNDSQHQADAVLMGLGVLLAMYTAFWYAVVLAIGWMRSEKSRGSG